MTIEISPEHEARPSRREPPGGWRAHEGLIGRVANPFYRKLGGDRSPVDLDDLVQVGRMGMLRAAESWDPARGAWSTFATIWMRHAMRRYAEDHSRTVRIPVHHQHAAYRAARAGAPLPPEMARAHSLDNYVGDEDGRTFGELLPANDTVDPIEKIGTEQEHDALRAALDELPERHRHVVVERFWRGRTLADVGRDLGLSREGARLIEVAALERLRSKMQKRAA